MSDEFDDEMEAADLGTRIAAARVIYEDTHGMTMAVLAEETGISIRTLKQFKRDQGWRKKQSTRPGSVSEDVVRVTEIMRSNASLARSAEPTEEAKKTAEIILAPLPGELNELLDRHRKEWTIARSMAAEAVKIRDVDPLKAFERAKLAKITAETLKLVQEGERRANGLDGQDNGAPVVVIERGQ